MVLNREDVVVMGIVYLTFYLRSSEDGYIVMFQRCFWGGYRDPMSSGMMDPRQDCRSCSLRYHHVFDIIHCSSATM